MERASADTWQKWMEKCIREQDKTCLTYLACARDINVLQNYFKMLLGAIQMNEFMKEAGTLTLFRTLLRKQANHKYVVKIIVRNMDIIKDT